MSFLVRFGAALIASAVLAGCVTKTSAGVTEKDRQLIDGVASDVNFVKHEQDNVDAQLRILDGRLATQDALLESARRELAEAQNASRQMISNKLINFESKLDTLSSTQKGLLGDMREMKTHSNDIAISLSQSKQKINEFEKLIEGQNRNIRGLEGALRSLMALVKSDELTPGHGATMAIKVAGLRSYRVKAGDTLERIANVHGITVDQIKSQNSLKSDLIRVGQELQIGTAESNTPASR